MGKDQVDAPLEQTGGMSSIENICRSGSGAEPHPQSSMKEYELSSVFY